MAKSPFFIYFDVNMTKEIKLNAEERKNIEGKLEKTDARKFVPANVYGENFENKHIAIKAQELQKIYNTAGESNLLDLIIEGNEPIKVMFKDVQTDPVKGTIIHVDFYKVDMAKKITTEIPLEFVGESKAVKDLGGMMLKNMDAVEVECLPSDLVDHIEVDISVLNTFEDSINLHDLKLPEGMKLTSETNDQVVSVSESKVEEEPEPETEEGTEAAEGEEKKEGESEATTEEEKKEDGASEEKKE